MLLSEVIVILHMKSQIVPFKDAFTNLSQNMMKFQDYMLTLWF